MAGLFAKYEFMVAMAGLFAKYEFMVAMAGLFAKYEFMVAIAVSPGQTGTMAWEPLRKPSGPRRLEESLDQVVSGLKAPRVQVLKMVFEAWEELVGAVMAAHSRPVRLVDGELVVAVDDPAWATEMRFFGGELIDRINTAAEDETVTELTIRVRPR